MSLSKEAHKLQLNILREYEISDGAGLAILKTALESFDRMNEAREIISKEGLQVCDRFGQLKAHPLLVIERDSRSQFLAALKQLNLDLEPLRDAPGRPGGR